MPPSRVCLVSPRLGAHSELARHDLPKRQEQLMLLTVWKGPSPRCSPHHGSQCERSRIKNLAMFRWPLLTLEHVRTSGEPHMIGEGETRALSLSDAATTFIGPMVR